MASAAKQAFSAPVETINIDALLDPILGGNPAGENLQYAGLYDEIREARREDEDLSQGDWKRDRKVADWPRVITLATEALATRTKDLQVGAWLAEALVKTEGFAGLRDGLRLMSELVERFWDHLYPEIDEDDIEGRANALSWMDRPLVLPKALKEVPISKNAGDAGYCYLQVEQSREFRHSGTTGRPRFRGAASDQRAARARCRRRQDHKRAVARFQSGNPPRVL